MNRKRLFLFLGLLVVMVFGSSPAEAAATANFQGKCNWNATFTQFTCTFDAQRPAASPSACPGSYIWKYSWEFDDGTYSGLTGNSTYTRSFPGSADPLVTLYVWCGNGEAPTRVRLVCVHFGVPGCIQVNGTWN